MVSYLDNAQAKGQLLGSDFLDAQQVIPAAAAAHRMRGDVLPPSPPIGRAAGLTRARAVATYAAHGGRPCPLDSRETLQERPCNARPCPVHCRLHAWGEWSDCSRSCGGGVQLREPRVRQWPAHGGQPCPGTERRACGTQPCPSAWQIWK